MTLTRARKCSLALLLAAGVTLAAAPAATARTSAKKAIWGPVEVNGVSQFPIYHDLGVGIFQTQIHWDQIAPTRPANPRDPSDPAYQWPDRIDLAVSEAARYHIRIALQIFGAPTWANGGHPQTSPPLNYSPKKPSDFADFARAASRRYPTVHLWIIWGEPSRRANWKPGYRERRGQPLTPKEATAPRHYAEVLDAAYGAFKKVDPANLVIGGNTFTTGDISPLNWIRSMRLPSGLPPRMDLYGHNPFSARKPDLRKPRLGRGFADFSDLDTLAHWCDRFLARGPGRKRHLRLFLSEFFVPTDHPNYEFNFYVDRNTQASWLTAALRITREWSRIYATGWFTLYDDPPNAANDEVARGLMDLEGRPKPAYYAYQRG
ncbi:MAG: polysaccharide biosynthesis protein PslG [Solirubrobacteraceae bacterium]|jgi:hypothetical protein|nr:polysaccharide biosynthesis protein PslG [Solirubrobacteraceae bacterium]